MQRCDTVGAPRIARRRHGRARLQQHVLACSDQSGVDSSRRLLLLRHPARSSSLHADARCGLGDGQTASADRTSQAFLFPVPAAPRTTRHRPHPRHAGRQDRAEPADERDAGGDGARALQVVVRGLRPRPRQACPEQSRRGRRPSFDRVSTSSTCQLRTGFPRPPQAPRRPLPRPPRRLRTRRDSGGVGGGESRRSLASIHAGRRQRIGKPDMSYVTARSTCRCCCIDASDWRIAEARRQQARSRRRVIRFGTVGTYGHARRFAARSTDVCSTSGCRTRSRTSTEYRTSSDLASSMIVAVHEAGSTVHGVPSATNRADFACVRTRSPPRP